MIRITIARIGCNKTVIYAVEELMKYLKAIDQNLMVDLRLYDAYAPNVKNVIWVGEDLAFDAHLPQVANRKLDDAIYVSIEKNAGVITGTNPRSVLLAVYRVLKELGVAWIRPTDDGEVIPQYSVTANGLDMKIAESASYRHRTICIEGCDCYENVEKIIEWIPRAGMSGYFFQFEHPITFFDKWYTHLCNTFWPNENVSKEDIKHMVRALEEEISKRDLLLHYYGHGFTSGALNYTADGWGHQKDSDISEDSRKYLAMVDGKRGFYNGMPLCTNLCYSNPEAQEMMVTAAVEYCKTHPDVDYLHFWLSDGANNVCECENCTEHISDYYMQMLNALDARLTAEGIDTKIVFLLYHDGWWAPQKEYFQNPDRFVLMLCPGGRKLHNSFAEVNPEQNYEIPEYVRNDTHVPEELGGKLAMMKQWQEQSRHSGESFDFDYHMCYWTNKDFGFFGMAEMICSDAKLLRSFGLDGMVSCQMNRSCFPTNLVMQMMADALWDNTVDFEVQSSKYFREAFGIDGEAVKEYLRAVCNHLEFGPGSEQPKRQQENYGDLLRIIHEFDMVLDKNLSKAEHAPAVRKSWEYMKEYRQLLLYYVQALYAQARGDNQKRDALTADAIDYLRCNEAKVYKCLDFWTYYSLLNRECGYNADICKDPDACVVINT